MIIKKDKYRRSERNYYEPDAKTIAHRELKDDLRDLYPGNPKKEEVVALIKSYSPSITEEELQDAFNLFLESKRVYERNRRLPYHLREPY